MPTLDALVADLHELRRACGGPSYAELATRIAVLREARGASPAAARVARSSVFDAFRVGRTRINADLVADIVRALGLPDDEARAWRTRCLTALPGASASAPPAPTPPAAATRVPVEHELDATARDGSRIPAAFAVLVLFGCVAINLLAGVINEKFALFIWLDTIGTAVAAITLGPGWGVVVAVLSHGVGVVTGQPETAAYAAVSVVAALLWGFGVRRWGMGRTVARMALLNTVVALACTLVAVPITVLVFGGQAGHASDAPITVLSAASLGLWLAALAINLLSSLLDKQVSGFIALLTVRGLELLRARDAHTGEAPFDTSSA